MAHHSGRQTSKEVKKIYANLGIGTEDIFVINCTRCGLVDLPFL